jgi:hypothetical protein
MLLVTIRPAFDLAERPDDDVRSDSVQVPAAPVPALEVIAPPLHVPVSSLIGPLGRPKRQRDCGMASHLGCVGVSQNVRRRFRSDPALVAALERHHGRAGRWSRRQLPERIRPIRIDWRVPRLASFCVQEA